MRAVGPASHSPSLHRHRLSSYRRRPVSRTERCRLPGWLVHCDGHLSGSLSQSRSFLDCGLRRNDGAASCHIPPSVRPGVGTGQASVQELDNRCPFALGQAPVRPVFKNSTTAVRSPWGRHRSGQCSRTRQPLSVRPGAGTGQANVQELNNRCPFALRQAPDRPMFKNSTTAVRSP